MDANLEKMERWHELFDALCDRAGFSDNMSLAARVCSATSGNGRSQFETAVRNLNNWRSGRHLPRLRSVRVLEQLLNVADNAELLDRWNLLYQRARLDEQEEGETQAPDAPNHASSASRPGARRVMASAAAGTALLAFGMVTGFYIGESGWRPWGRPAEDAPLIHYRSEVLLTVGESQIVHGERGDCGKLPRDWPDVWGNLPTSSVGEFSNGGLVRRNSMFCKGVTPARGIRFTATRAGVEEMYIAGDYMKITVVEPSDDTMADGEEPAG